MSIAIELARTLPSDPTAADAVGVGVFADRLEAGDVPEPLDRAFLDGQGFTGKPGQTCVVPGENGAVVVAVGLGHEGDATVATYRRAAAALARAAQRQRHVATDLFDGVPERLDRPELAQAIAEGIVLGAYRYTELKSDPEPSRIGSLLVVGKGGKRVAAALDRGRAIAEAVVPRPRPRQPARRDTHADRLRGASRGAGGVGGFSAEVLDRAAIEDTWPRRPAGGQPRVRRGAPVREAGVGARAPAGDRGAGG